MYMFIHLFNLLPIAVMLGSAILCGNSLVQMIFLTVYIFEICFLKTVLMRPFPSSYVFICHSPHVVLITCMEIIYILQWKKERMISCTTCMRVLCLSSTVICFITLFTCVKFPLGFKIFCLKIKSSTNWLCFVPSFKSFGNLSSFVKTPFRSSLVC